MNHPAKPTAFFFTALIIAVTNDARAQYVPTHDPVHFGFAPFCDIPSFVDVPYCAGCAGLGCAGGCCVTPPPIIINAPVVFNVQPLLPRVRPVNDAAARPVENFAAPAGAPNAGGPHDGLNEIRRRAAILKTSTPAARARADRSISAGDTAFANQIYARATAKYREAIARAPDYAAAHFRLAHAYVATRQYNLALASALVALELSGTSKRDGFSLAEMYRGNKLARRSHDEELEDAALREPADGGLKFLMAFTLNYGGNPLKAREIFRQSAGLQGAHQAYVRYFLPVTPVEEPRDPVAIVD